jgi:hypothetical protein
MARAARLLLLTGTVAIAVAARPACAQQPALDADAIFVRARSVAEARVLPPYLEYTTYAAFVRKGHIDAEHFHVIVRTADGMSYVTPVPDSPADRIDTKPYVQAAPPYFWPATTFGLAREQRNDSQTFGLASGAAVASPEPSPSPIATIGSVHAVMREYTVTLAGLETVDGARTYHLLLVPKFDPQVHQIREAYVDAETFQTRRLVVAVYAKMGPIHSQPRAVVDYEPIGAAWLVSRGRIDFTLRFGPFAFAGSGEFRLLDVRAPADEPDWMFDKAKLAAHGGGNR